MFPVQKRWLFLGLTVILLLSCSLADRFIAPTQQVWIAPQTPELQETQPLVGPVGREFQSRDFSLSAPTGWTIHAGPSGTGKNAWNYFALNLNILVEVQRGQRLPVLSVTSRELPPESSLEDVFADTYAQIEDQINQVAETEQTTIDGQPAWVKRYNRPWGEPWYSFEDTWVQVNGQVFVISCQLNLDPAPEDRQACAGILGNLDFHPAPGETDSPAPTTQVEAGLASPEPPATEQVVTPLPPEGCPQNLGKLVFSYDPHDLDSVHYGLEVMDPDGGNRTRLSSPDELHHNQPAWSPERCRIAFVSHTPDGDEDIFVMNADGGGIRRLTNDPAREIFPDWSPDGKQIAFISYRDGYRNLYVMEADGSNPRQLTFNQKEFTQWIAWSPSGEFIAYTYNPESDEIGTSLHIIRPDGSDMRQVTPPAGPKHHSEPSWSPDSQKLYFISNRSAHNEIWEINLDGSGLRQISSLYGSGVGIDHSLRLSPDGSSLIFWGAGWGADYMTDLYRIGVDGSGLTNLTQSPGQEEWVDW